MRGIIRKTAIIIAVMLLTSIIVLSGKPVCADTAGNEIKQTYTGADGNLEIRVASELSDGVVKSGPDVNVFLSVEIKTDIKEEIDFKWSIVSGSVGFSSGEFINSDGTVSFKFEKADNRPSDTAYSYVLLKPSKAGTSVVRFSCSKASVDIPVVVFPREVPSIKTVEQISFFKAEITIECPTNDYDGYVIYRKENGGKAEEAAVINGGNNSKCEVDIPHWGSKYRFLAYGYINHEEKRAVNAVYPLEEVDPYFWSKEFTSEDTGATVKSIEAVGSSDLQITWEKVDEAVSYDLYESETGEFGKYVKAATIPSSEPCTYVRTVKKGITYNYYVVIHFSNGYVSKNSNRLSGFIPNEKLKKRSKDINGFNLNNYAEPNYYYSTEKSRFLIDIVYSKKTRKLVIYKIDDNLNLKKHKVVKLEKFDLWGGFYKGIDDNFYVVYGYSNPAEKDDKTVIKVVQFNSKWKKQKTAIIKGSASNSFKGINQPFRAGTVSMTMKDDTLFIHTSRLMFRSSDGKNHQSNISFEVNTKTMTAKTANYNYTSHSFNQFARYKDNDLYLVDHGDAYPRSIAVTRVRNYKSDNEKTAENNVFDFMGKTGENYTGANIGGTEVGQHNILIAGTSVPHKNKVKGVTGYDYSLKKNVYLITVDRVTGKKTFKWLTTYNPKKSKVTVKNAKLVKICDSRFAILYSTEENKKDTLHYLVVDDSGNVLYKKSYKNMIFSGSTQPLLDRGYIMWTESFYQQGSNYKGKYIHRIYRLPVVTGNK